jgi:predicted permease
VTEFRHIIRGLIRTPLFAITAIVSLALGIGANTAMFSMIDRALLRTLPVKDPHELAFLYHPGPTQGSTSTEEPGDPSFSYPMFREMQQQQTAFTGLAGSRGGTVNLSYKNNAQPGSAHLVSGNYFRVLGVTAAIGRVFDENDDQTISGHPVVVLSYGYWSSRFGEDVSVLNETLVVNGHPMTIVGVAQKGFTTEIPGTARDVFVPITMKREITPDWDGLTDRQDYWVTLVGRLKPGSTFEQAATAINVTYRAQLEQDVALLKGSNEDFIRRFRAKKIVLREGDYGRGQMRAQSRTPLLLLIGMTLLVLLIACANVANLQLARATARTREIALRLALGASRGQLIRRLLTESCVIAVAGGLLGLAVAQGTLRGILASLPPRQATAGIVSTDLDPRVLLFSLALSVVTGIIFGLYPALHASRADLTSSLKDQSGQSTSTRATGFFRRSLVTMQIAISLLLLIAAVLFGQTLINLTRVELGIRPDHLVTLSVNPKLNRYSEDRTVQFFERLSERLAALPGVTLVSASRVAAIGGSRSSTSVTVEGFSAQKDGDSTSHLNAIGPDFFRTLGIPLVAGREFTAADNVPTAPRQAIVNESFVRHFLSGGPAIGRRFGRGTGNNTKLDITIIGVAKDAKYSDLRETIPRVFYTPYRHNATLAALNFYLRTAVEPESVIPAIRRELTAIDPDLPLRDLRSMQAQLDSRTSNERLLSRLTGAFGGLATLLAAIGLYGVLAYNVATRTREIGIRVALGAKATDVRWLIVKEVAVMFVVGIVLGVTAAGGVGQLLKGTLFGVRPLEPVVYVSAVAVLGIIALAAAYFPARRATNVDPLIALKYE